MPRPPNKASLQTNMQRPGAIRAFFVTDSFATAQSSLSRTIDLHTLHAKQGDAVKGMKWECV
ncbi:hypothetical protein AGRO_4536 [Agrobacterium sp. ATCC 31749]|nr:hypothetical protein AGRO_4536 [Agrobacterium sp. ATCC 31749]